MYGKKPFPSSNPKTPHIKGKINKDDQIDFWLFFLSELIIIKNGNYLNHLLL